MAKDNTDKPLPPKRPLSGFFLFRQDRYKDIVAANPKKNVADITKLISVEWNKLGDDRKKQYNEKYGVAKVKFDKEMKDYVDKYGKVERKKKIKRAGKDKAAKGAKKSNAGKSEAKGKKAANNKKQA